MDSGTGLYDKLIQPLEGRMIRCIRRVVRNADDAEDALQEALATIWKRLDQIERHPNPQAVILRIRANAAYDGLRRAIRRRTHETAHAMTVGAADPAPEAVETLATKERQAAVLRAISRLPRRQAETVLLRVILEQSYADIATALDCNEATARTHFTRGRAWLSRELAYLLPSNSQEARQ